LRAKVLQGFLSCENENKLLSVRESLVFTKVDIKNARPDSEGDNLSTKL
jgi:hypothetical protein